MDFTSLSWDSPSRLDGVPLEVEEGQIAFAADLISEAGRCLRVPQFVILTAKFLVHRFFMVASLRDNCIVWIAGASLLIACKFEEHRRAIRDVANVVHFAFCRRVHIGPTDGNGLPLPLRSYGEDADVWKSKIIEAERMLLNSVGFDICCEHPHKFLLVFLGALRDKSEMGATFGAAGPAQWREFCQTAWNIANDLYRVVVPILLAPEVCACGCIAIAAKKHGLTLPKEWEKLYGGDAEVFDEMCLVLERVESLSPTFSDLSGSDILSLCE